MRRAKPLSEVWIHFERQKIDNIWQNVNTRNKKKTVFFILVVFFPEKKRFFPPE